MKSNEKEEQVHEEDSVLSRTNPHDRNETGTTEKENNLKEANNMVNTHIMT